MRSAIAATLLVVPAGAQVLEDFEHGSESLYVAANSGNDTFNVSSASDHDGTFGGAFIMGTNPTWRLRADLPTSPGNVYRAYVRLRGGVATNGRSYIGVGATLAGTWSAVFAPNTSQVLLQNNAAFGFVTAGSAAAAIVPDTWYVLELDWASNGNMTVRLLDEAGTSELASTGVVATGFTTAGGLAFRGFTTNAAAFHDIDTMGGVLDPLTITDCLPATFVDISGTGTPLNLVDDGEVNIATTIGNAVLAAGTARVGSNGGVRFRGAGTDLGFTNGALPSSAAFGSTAQSILPFWDDFDTVGGTVGNIYWQEVGAHLIVQWENAGFFNTPPAQRATFQAQIPDDGATYAKFVYDAVQGTRANGGGSATIGYQGGTPGGHFQHSFDAPFAVRNGTVLSLVSSDYVFRDDLGGSFTDISGTGTALNLSDDAAMDIATTVGNSLFPAGTARVGSNGVVRFMGSGDTLAFTNFGLPHGGVFANGRALAPFWDDVNTSSGANGNIYWQEIGNRLIVQWEDVAFFGAALSQRATFQLQVFGSGGTFARFVYQDIEGARADRGSSATIGFQSGDLRGSVQWSSNTEAVEDGMSLSLVAAATKAGTNYCNPNPNSTGNTGLMTGNGSTSVSTNDLVLRASRLPVGAFGYFLASTTTGFNAVAGSQGNICLAGNIGRVVGGSILISNGSGVFSINAGLGAIPTPGGPVPGMAGDTWNFQAWHRDLVGGVPTSNFTDAMQFQLTP